MQSHKETLLEKLRNHIRNIREKIRTDLEAVHIVADRSFVEIAKIRPQDDQTIALRLKYNAMARREELQHLYQTPYFTKCEIIENTTEERKTYFFAKHQMINEAIYSWVAPIASIRFESPGEIAYTLPSGEEKKLTLVSKEQYMIVDGEVIFFAREERSQPRELIYQQHFTRQKSEFILPEIVAQMEKAQDQVIRAHHYGPLVISGPAGSGKTTLALHRVAYLTQAPDTAPLYKPESIIVFVQDSSTKEYFSHLLPGLGIHNVTITTFSEWACTMLYVDTGEFSYIHRYGSTDEERDSYEYEKLKVLRSGTMPTYQKDIYSVLTRAYKDMSSKYKKLLQQQKVEKKLDRFDLTILLLSYLEKNKKFETRKTYHRVIKRVVKEIHEKKPVVYSLAVIDEFQNYLPEQLGILKQCINEETASSMYVGDFGQQVYLGTLKNWSQFSEDIELERNIRLNKVYRNTKSILNFISDLGYSITIPESLNEGLPVVQRLCDNPHDEIEYIQSIISPYKKGSIGIIAKTSSYLEVFKEAFGAHQNIHMITINESQGLEFDLVCIVGIDANTFDTDYSHDVLPEHIEERKRIQKDLLYIALTRAISELHIVGRCLLK